MIRPCLLAGAALLLGGCVAVTVNVSFPQDSIDGAASAIEDRVRAPAPAAAPAPAGRLGRALRSSAARPDSVILQTWTSFAGPGVAHAESIRRDIRTPAADLARVQAGFARRNRERAPAGTWMQAEGGDWIRK